MKGVPLVLAWLAGCDGNAPPRRVDARPSTVVASQPDAAPLAGLNVESIVAGMIKIPAGEYIRGCRRDPVQPPESEHCQRVGDRVDVHHLGDFWIEPTEVTVAAYRKCVEQRGCTPPVSDELCASDQRNWGHPDREDHPVNCVTAEQAVAYCDWRGGTRLPTPDEWEKAARGSDGRMFPWGDLPPSCDLAIMRDAKGTDGCGTTITWPVGSRPAGASPYGVLDMVGNVAEYTHEGGALVGGSLRGGGLREDRASSVHPWKSGGPGFGETDTGFRCAYSLVPPKVTLPKMFREWRSRWRRSTPP